MFESKFEVCDEKAEASLNEIGRRIAEALPHGYGFALLVFNYGPDGSMFYISSAQRADMINAMREFIAEYEVTQ